MNFDKPFQDKLRHHEEMPNTDVWARLNQMLDEQPEEEKAILTLPTKRKMGLTVYSVAASVALLVIAFGVVQWGRQGMVQQETTTKATKKHIQIPIDDSVERLAKDNFVIKPHSVERLASVAYTFAKDSLKKQPKANTPKDSLQKTRPTNLRPKKIPALPARTELIAQLYASPALQPLFEEYEWDEVPAPFQNIEVTVVFQPEKPSKIKRKRASRAIASKNRESQRKPQFKILGFVLNK